MTVSRVLLTAVLILSAAILEVTVVNVLPLPGDGPDLVLLVLIGLSLVCGPTYGAITGFLAGLLVDLIPPIAIRGRSLGAGLLLGRLPRWPSSHRRTAFSVDRDRDRCSA